MAVGIGLFVLLRPWRDGLTFPAFNAYFMWLVAFVALVWSVQMIVRPKPLRASVAQGILIGYLLLVYVTGFGTINYDLTHRAFLNLTSYVLLFILCVNALRTGTAVGIVMGAFVLTTVANAFWSIVHFHVYLPNLRELLAENSSLLYHYFGTPSLTAELKHRLETNRAFGTFLFPNALGAYSILVLPYFAVTVLPVWRELKGNWLRVRAGSTPVTIWRRAYLPLILSAAAGIAALVAPFLLNEIVGGANPKGIRPVESFSSQVSLFGGGALFAAGISFFCVRRYGVGFYGLALKALSISLALFLGGWALWLTYSRGAILALVVSSGVTVICCFISFKRTQILTMVAKAVSILLLAGVALFFAQQATAQRVTPPDLMPSPLTNPGGKLSEMREALDTLDVEGRSLKVAHLTDPGSFTERITYWQVGLLMFKSHFFRGVGIGAFKIDYPNHQFLDSGDVEAAHNDYLQAFIEAGILGGFAFSAIWIYFALYGARRIIRERDRQRRLMIAGLYAGVLAFATHAIVDFNFANPGLASLVYVLSGVFFAVCANGEDVGESRLPASAARFAALPVFAFAVLLAAALFQLFVYDYSLSEGMSRARLWNVGDRKALDQRLEAAQYVIREMPTEAVDPRRPSYRQVSEMTLLFGGREVMEGFGVVRVPDADDRSKVRPLKPGEDPPADSFLFFTDRDKAVETAVDLANDWIEHFEEVDELYPSDAEMAVHLYQWNVLRVEGSKQRSDKKRYAKEAVAWAQEARDRSPNTPWFHKYLGDALWLEASVDPGPRGLDLYYTGLEEYKTARELFPISPIFWEKYATAQTKLGQALIDAGNRDEGERMVEAGAKDRKVAIRLAQYKGLIAFQETENGGK